VPAPPSLKGDVGETLNALLLLGILDVADLHLHVGEFEVLTLVQPMVYREEE
jgi:hypothetical protein